jgi:hypothetical protein
MVNLTCRTFSSAPLKRNTTACRKASEDVDKTRRTSSITEQLTASSLAPSNQKNRFASQILKPSHYELLWLGMEFSAETSITIAT